MNRRLEPLITAMALILAAGGFGYGLGQHQQLSQLRALLPAAAQEPRPEVMPEPPQPTVAQEPRPEVMPEPPQPQPTVARESFVAQAVHRAGPATVRIDVERTVDEEGMQDMPELFRNHPFFREFFPRGRGEAPFPPRVRRGQGTGVIFDAEGLVLTNAHVVQGSDDASVTLTDGRRLGAKVLGRDAITDLAVLQLDTDGSMPVVTLGDSDAVKVGDWAITVGNPYGLNNTVTLGIISSIDRDGVDLGITGKRLDLIQTDAAINPGNSGGPLLNAAGEVVGINTLVRSGPGAGLGFAIPINRAEAIARQLVASGKVSHAMIGVRIQVHTAELARKDRKDPNGYGNLPERSGALVVQVVPDSPAAAAGLRKGDVIIEAGDGEITDPSAMVEAVERAGVGAALELTLVRQGKTITLEVVPTDMQELGSRSR